MTLTEEQRGTAAFDLEKARAVDIDILAATDWGELRAMRTEADHDKP